MEETLIICKPDAYERGLVGEILRRMEQRGLKLTAMRLLTIDRELASQHYAEHEGKGFFEELVEFIGRSPAVVAVVQGEDDTIAMVRTMVGPTNPVDAPPGTIRGDYGQLVGENLVHASDSPESAKREIGLFFPEYYS